MADFRIVFENKFKISTLMLRVNRSHPEIKRDLKWFAQITIMLTTIVFCCGLLVNSIFFHDLKTGKVTEACKNVIMVILCALVTFKYFILCYYRLSLKNLIDDINKDYKSLNKMSYEERKIVLEYADRGVYICKIWIVIAVATGALFPLKAFFMTAFNYFNEGIFQPVPMFDLTYPLIMEEVKTELPVFTGFFLLHSYFGIYTVVIFIGFDPLGPIFMLHACGQLEVAKYRIMRLYTNASNSGDLNNKLNDIVALMQNIYNFVEEIQNNFVCLYEINMKYTTVAIPFSALQIAASFNLEFMSFLLGSFAHFFIPCYYSDLLMDKGESVREAMYACGWENNTDTRARTTLLLNLTRFNKAPVIRTFFYAICLDTFAEMCRQSYAIFNLLNAAWN